MSYVPSFNLEEQDGYVLLKCFKCQGAINRWFVGNVPTAVVDVRTAAYYVSKHNSDNHEELQ